MRLVNDDEIPVKVEHGVVLVEIAADELRAAKILNGGKVDEILTVVIQPTDLQIVFIIGLFVEGIGGVLRLVFKGIIVL